MLGDLHFLHLSQNVQTSNPTYQIWIVDPGNRCLVSVFWLWFNHWLNENPSHLWCWINLDWLNKMVPTWMPEKPSKENHGSWIISWLSSCWPNIWHGIKSTRICTVDSIPSYNVRSPAIRFVSRVDQNDHYWYDCTNWTDGWLKSNNHTKESQEIKDSLIFRPNIRSNITRFVQLE